MPAGLEFEVNYTIFEIQKSITGNFDYDEFCSAIISHYSAVVFIRFFVAITTMLKVDHG